MQHLFNRIYLAPTYSIESQTDNGAVIILTSNPAVSEAIKLQHLTGDETSTEQMLIQLQQVRFKTEVGELIHYSKTYKEMIFNHYGGNDIKFFERLLGWDENRRLTIYGDLSQLEHILVAWFKTILPHMSRNEAYKIMRLMSVREKMYIKNHKPSYLIPAEAPYNLSVDTPADLDFLYDTTIWNSSNLFPIDSNKKYQTVGLEFLLATYLWNILGGRDNTLWPGTPVLHDKVLRFVKKRLVQTLFDYKETIAQTLYGAEQLFGMQFDITDPAAVEAFVATNIQYNWLFDDEFTPENYQSVWAAYNINEVFVCANQLIQKIDREQEIYDGVKYQTLLSLFKNDFTLQDVLNVEMASPFSRLILSTEITDKAINRYLVDYIFRLYKTGDSATLKQLCIS